MFCWCLIGFVFTGQILLVHISNFIINKSNFIYLNIKFSFYMFWSCNTMLSPKFKKKSVGKILKYFLILIIWLDKPSRELHYSDKKSFLYTSNIRWENFLIESPIYLKEYNKDNFSGNEPIQKWYYGKVSILDILIWLKNNKDASQQSEIMLNRILLNITRSELYTNGWWGEAKICKKMGWDNFIWIYSTYTFWKI